MSTEPPLNPGTEDKLFAATLTPHRSLSPRGFLLVMALVGGISFVAGMAFLAMGAWPVFGFFGLDVLLVYLAFRRNYAAGRAFEEVELTRQRLTLRRVSHRGRESRFEFNPYWTRLYIFRNEDGVQKLLLSSGGLEVPVGDWLSPDEKHDFSRAFGRELNKVSRFA